MSFPIATAAVGTVIDRKVVDVTFRMTSAYAAAIGAIDDRYLDDGVAGGPVAPPAFLVVLEWPMLLKQPYIGAIGAPEDRYFERLLHAFQDTTFHRVVRPGDRLELRVELSGIRPTAAGALVVCTVETCLAEGGEPVATSWIGSLFRGCPVSGDATIGRFAPELGPATPEGVPFEPVSIEITRALPFVYTECSGHWNPIHTERAYARAAGYPDLVVHGTSTLAIACQRLIHAHAAGDPRRLRRFGARFSNLLTPDQTLRLRHAPVSRTRSSHVAFAVEDADGRAVLGRGIAAFVDGDA